jgi:hypothetical protein
MLDATFWFPIIKLVHLGGLFLWLGPSTGAWLLLQLAKRRLDQQGLEYRSLYRDYLSFFWLEHLGLLLLLGSGIFLLTMHGFSALEWFWLKWKLALILCVILPIEMIDIWFGHVRLPRFFSTESASTEPRRKMDSYALYEHRFVPVALLPLLISVVIIIWLALAKPT